MSVAPRCSAPPDEHRNRARVSLAGSPRRLSVTFDAIPPNSLGSASALATMYSELSGALRDAFRRFSL